VIDPPVPSADVRLVIARRGLSEKVAELQRRVDRARAALSPARHLRNPWLRLGAAVVVGYAAGNASRSSALRTLSRRLVVFAATAIVRDVLRTPDRTAST
jgi:hypothetical protein